jgi:hypothetical protein
MSTIDFEEGDEDILEKEECSTIILGIPHLQFTDFKLQMCR